MVLLWWEVIAPCVRREASLSPLRRNRSHQRRRRRRRHCPQQGNTVDVEWREGGGERAHSGLDGYLGGATDTPALPSFSSAHKHKVDDDGDVAAAAAAAAAAVT